MTPTIFDLVPWNAHMPETPQMAFIGASVVVLLLSIRYLYSEVRRRNDLVPLYAFLGGGLVVIYEPLGDILASVYYPAIGQVSWIDLFGRKVPLFIGLLYFWYMSVPAIYFARRVEEGVTSRSLWKMYLFSLLIATGIELLGVNVGAWVYYGPHPYVFFGVPLWCPVSYSGFLVAIAVGVKLMTDKLPKKRHWMIVFILPFFMAGGHLVVSLPAAAAMFSTQQASLIWLGATCSIAMSLLLVFLADQLYCSRPVISSKLDAVS